VCQCFPLQDEQLVAVHEEQLLSEDAWTDPSELPKLQTEISFRTESPEQPGQTIPCPCLSTSFSNLRPQSLQENS
jgi:hypothetical protein